MAKRPLLPPFSVSLAGVEDAVREGLAKTISCLAPLELSVDEAGTVELVLAEALNNVVEHALAETNKPSKIQIQGAPCARGLCVTVIDHGAPMPTGFAPGAIAPEVDVATSEMPEGGFGWFMIHTLAQDVQYARIGTANHLMLRLAVGL